MFIHLHRTLEKLGENLPRDGRITFGMLEKAYALTLRLRSQLLGAMYDRSISVLLPNGSSEKSQPPRPILWSA